MMGFQHIATTIMAQHLYFKLEQIEICYDAPFVKTATSNFFIVVVTGEVTIQLEQLTYVLTEGDILHVTYQPWQVVKYTTQTTFYTITYQHKFPYETPSYRKIMQHSFFAKQNKPQHTTKAQHLYASVRRLYNSSEKGAKQYQFLYFIQEWLKHIASQSKRSIFPIILTYIEEKLPQPITVQELLHYSNLTIKQLQRYFMTELQLTPKQYIQCKRLQFACYYLQNTTFTQKEIATVFAISNEKDFNKMLKRWTSYSSMQIRKICPPYLAEKPLINEKYFHYTNNQFARLKLIESRGNELKKVMKVVAMPFLLSMILLLQACQETTNATHNPKMRVVTDDLGRKVEIPVEPERILTDMYIEHLLVLGIKPIGSGEYALEKSYLHEEVKDVKNIGTPLNLESMIDEKPDLNIVIAFDGKVENLEKLEKIAPTIAVNWEDDVYTQVRSLAKLLAKEDEAEAWITKLTNEGEQAQHQLQQVIQPHETVTLVEYGDQLIPNICGGRNYGHLFYQLLGYQPTEHIKQKMDESKFFWAEEVSEELLPEVIGDWVFIEGKTKEEIENDVAWQHVEAVKNNRVVYLPTEPFSSYSPLAIEKSIAPAIKLIQAKK